jgi:site-specific DNA-methyltransferase (adenine-specific)
VQSIRERGILEPLVIKQDGTIISGHRRWRAAAALKMEHVPCRMAEYADALDEQEAVIEFNRQRVKTFEQKWNEGQHRERIERERQEMLRRQKIGAARVGIEMVQQIAPSKTRDVVAEAVGFGSGENYRRAGKVMAAAASGNEKAQELVQKLNREETTVHAAFKEITASEKAAQRKAEDEHRVLLLPPREDRCRLIVGDLATVEIAPGSIDAIITDPPYPKEYLPLYGVLAERAALWLKPGGGLIAMAGQSYLPEILALITPHLQYHWMLGYMAFGPHTQLWQRNIMSGWKPVLWFVKGKYVGAKVFDVVRSDEQDKDHHEWGQSVSGTSVLIERFTRPGDVVLDPFVGGGATAVAALRLNRLFIGIDVDAAAIETTRARVVGL